MFHILVLLSHMLAQLERSFSVIPSCSGFIFDNLVQISSLGCGLYEKAMANEHVPISQACAQSANKNHLLLHA